MIPILPPKPCGSVCPPLRTASRKTLSSCSQRRPNEGCRYSRGYVDTTLQGKSSYTILTRKRQIKCTTLILKLPLDLSIRLLVCCFPPTSRGSADRDFFDGKSLSTGLVWKWAPRADRVIRLFLFGQFLLSTSALDQIQPNLLSKSPH